MSRPFQLVIYGATGFTGQLVAHYLAVRHPTLRWAIAGRSEPRLRELAEKLRKAYNRDVCGVLVGADSTSSQVTSQTDAIITTAGPYALYGEPLLSACIDTRTHYANLTGESPWVEIMQQKYEARAKERGVAIINMCGFDSIPADSGVLFLAHESRRLFPGSTVSSVKGYMNGSGNVSGGTIASGLNVAANPQLRRLAEDPFLLVPTSPADARSSVVPVPDAEWPARVPTFNKVAAPFVMAAINTRVVRRSVALLKLEGQRLIDAAAAAPAPTGGAGAQAGTDASTDATGGLATLALPAGGDGRRTIGYTSSSFAYSEYMLLPSLMVAYIATFMMAVGRWAMSVGCLRGIIARFVPQPGQGPSVAAMSRSWFHYNLVGQVATSTGTREVVARVAGGDGGYEETAKMLAEAGVLLATKMATGGLPAAALGGGFLTPATAFGMHLPNRLTAQGLTFEIVSAGSGEGGRSNAEEQRKLLARGRPGASWMDGANIGATTSRA